MTPSGLLGTAALRVACTLALLLSLLSVAAAQTCVPPPEGLVSWWPGEGDATDIVGGNDGTVEGGTTFAPGMVGQAFSFDGIDDYIRVPNHPSLNLTDGLTIEAWINIAFAPNQGAYIVSKWNETVGEWSYFIAHTPDTRLGTAFSESIQADLALLEGNTSIPLGTWVHVATTYEVSEGIVRLYLNGVEDASLEVGAGRRIDASLTDLLIGAVFTNGSILQNFAGLIDEVSIYNRALTAEEITAIYNAGSAGKCQGPVFLVTTTQDSGPGSLRQAILDANATQTALRSTIAFHIPRTDPGFARHVFTLQPTTPLPAVRRPTVIDGTSQTTFSGDSNPLGPEMVLNGSLVPRGQGLVLRGNRSAVTGLVINGFAHGAGIRLQPNATGDQPPSHHRLRNNYIGTDRTGTRAVPNAQGVVIHGGGSPNAQAQANQLTGNLIAGNLGVGVRLCEAADTRLTGNRIGTDRTGTAPLGNGSHGLHLRCAGAPRTLIEENTIAFNAGDGIRLAPDYRAAVALTPDGHQGTTIRHNALFANAGLGINLLPPPAGTTDGSTPNDVCDADGGANRLQNFPDIFLATSDGWNTVISGMLNSLPNQSYTLEFFATAAAESASAGQTFMGEATIATDATCQGRFTVTLPGGFGGQVLTATATDAAGNTSELSPAVGILETARSCQGGGQAVITGQITTADDDQGLAEVAVQIFREEDSCQAQTTTDTAGDYRLDNLGGGTYLVIPHHPVCRFTPAGWRVRLEGGNAQLSFVATCP